MATVALSLVFGQAGEVLAQSSTPSFLHGVSEVKRKPDSSQATAELFYMIEQLQNDVRRLQGEVEEQRHLITSLQKQGRDRYIDMDQRILELSEKLTASPAAQTAPAAAPPAAAAGQVSAGGNPAGAAMKVYRQPGAEELKSYEEIQDLIRVQKRYDEAIGRLYDFIDKYPEGDLAVNAYYWLGEVYLVKPQLEQAKQAFTIVATRYPDHRKAPDAVYKLGIALDRLGERQEARRRMESVVRSYPGTRAAKLAQDYLAQHNG